jgi:hypothetical protein
LQQERDGLVRQLSAEKESHQKTQEENRGLRQEKSRLEEQVRSVQFCTEKEKCLQFGIGISVGSTVIPSSEVRFLIFCVANLLCILFGQLSSIFLHVLVKCKVTQSWRQKYLDNKWFSVNKEVA